VIPVYNEVHTIGQILIEVTKALPEITKQIVIVDDCSSDGTSEWLRKNLTNATQGWRRLSLDAGGGLVKLSVDGPQNQSECLFTVLFHERNRGKGAAVRTGLASACGNVLVIQDADLEYNPNGLVAHASDDHRSKGSRCRLRFEVHARSLGASQPPWNREPSWLAR
jgi:glycosyltransferase involved in cell wall biosynthesis